MGDEPTTKVCRACCERIDARAKRCPRCRMPQTRWAFALHPGFVAATLSACALGFLLLTLGMASQFRAGEDFTGHRGELEIFESEMVFSEHEGRTKVALVGKLRNISDIPWENVRIDVEFMDQDGRLIDAQSDVLRGKTAPGDERAFRVDRWAYLPRERYASYEVYVTAAKDARSFL